MLKKAVAFLFALMLVPLYALADVKSANISLDITWQGIGDIQGSLGSMATANGLLYLANYQDLYTWSPETGKINSTPFAEEPPWGNLVARDESLYYLNMHNGALSACVREGGKFVLKEDCSLEWSLIQPNGPDNVEYYCNVYAAFFMDGYLYLCTDRTDIEDRTARAIHRFNIETGYAERLYVGKDLQNICAYKDSKLLAIRFDRDKYYSIGESPNGSVLPAITLFDPKSKTFADTLFTIKDSDFGGLCYGAAMDTVYLSTGGRVMYKQGDSALMPLNYLPASYIPSFAAATLIGDSHYALAVHDAIYIRSLSPDDTPAQALVIEGGQLDYAGREGYMAFMRKYPEVPISNPAHFFTTQGIFLDMLTDTAADIYSVIAIEEIEMLVEKGYCANLSGNAEIQSAVADMYPHLVSSFTKDGKVYAVPYHAETFYALGYSPSLLKDIGLTEADLPADFSEFLDFLIDWADIYSRDYPDYSLVSHQNFKWRDELTRMLTMQQAYYCMDKGIPLTFDTPELLALFTKLDAMTDVFKQLDPSHDVLNAPAIYDPMDPLTAIFTTNHPLVGWRNSYEEDYVPLPMNYLQDAPMVNVVRMQMLFLNPQSKNTEAALHFLEEMAANPSAITKALLRPSANKPVEKVQLYEDIFDYETELQLLQASLEAADESERRVFEDKCVFCQFGHRANAHRKGLLRRFKRQCRHSRYCAANAPSPCHAVYERRQGVWLALLYLSLRGFGLQPLYFGRNWVDVG